MPSDRDGAVGKLIVGDNASDTPARATISHVSFADLDRVEDLNISKHSYCVETKFCSRYSRIRGLRAR